MTHHVVSHLVTSCGVINLCYVRCLPEVGPAFLSLLELFNLHVLQAQKTAFLQVAGARMCPSSSWSGAPSHRNLNSLTCPSVVLAKPTRRCIPRRGDVGAGLLAQPHGVLKGQGSLVEFEEDPGKVAFVSHQRVRRQASGSRE